MSRIVFAKKDMSTPRYQPISIYHSWSVRPDSGELTSIFYHKVSRLFSETGGDLSSPKYSQVLKFTIRSLIQIFMKLTLAREGLDLRLNLWKALNPRQVCLIYFWYVEVADC
jgi:hypothetical protein